MRLRSLVFLTLVAAGCQLPTFAPNPDGVTAVQTSGGTRDGGAAVVVAPKGDGGVVADGGSASDGGSGGIVTSDGGVPQSACINRAAANGDGHHRPGEACRGCHNGTNQSNMPLAGTVYQNGQASSGVTIEIIDAANKVIRLTSGANGNFYTYDPIAAPYKVRATACPADRPMGDPVTDGNCNSCHGANNRISL